MNCLIFLVLIDRLAFISFKTGFILYLPLKLVIGQQIYVLFIFLSFLASVTPKITLKGKDEVTIVEGNVLYLFCQVEGHPKPLITWKKDGKVLQGSLNKTDFIIYEAKKNDAGNYECEASNSVGTVSYTVQVTIQGIVTLFF